MDRDRSADALTDALDREIDRALRIDPSPEFLARVRMRIASEPAPPADRRLWWLIACPVAAALCLEIVIAPPPVWRSRIVTTPPLMTRAVAPGFVPMPPDVTHAVRVGPFSTRSSAARAPQSPIAQDDRREATGVAARGEPEVLVSEAEARALRALIRDVREARIDLTQALRSSPPSVLELAPIVPIEVAPIEITPLTPNDGDKGVRP